LLVTVNVADRLVCLCPAAKRSAPIPVMVEEVDFDDGSFSGEIENFFLSKLQEQ